MAGLTAALLLAPTLAAAVDGFTTGNVNMRTGPGTGFDKITTLPAGTGVDVMGCTDNGWCQVSAGGPPGWVSRSYLERMTGPPPVMVAPPIVVEPPYYGPGYPVPPPPYYRPPYRPPYYGPGYPGHRPPYYGPGYPYGPGNPPPPGWRPPPGNPPPPGYRPPPNGGNPPPNWRQPPQNGNPPPGNGGPPRGYRPPSGAPAGPVEPEGRQMFPCDPDPLISCQ